MNVTIIVFLKVEDFEKWHTVFASMDSNRQEAGIHVKAHLHIDEPNNAVVIGTVPSKEDFLTMFATPEMQERQKNAGVLGLSEVTLLEEA